MTKEEIINKLKELGIETENVYPKNSFVGKNGLYNIGLYVNELKSDFYFYNKFDKAIFKIPYQKTLDFDTEEYQGRTKYQVPQSIWEKVWKDEALVTPPNEDFKNMTLRDYACIHLRVPKTEHPWLNELIKETSPR